ncbi:hypothetical protein EYF80_013527 [Liparis tanakae]|uniref:Uncharacterized protein n=1 Tax=Liparis tanakae TaxID=230148 RepID=A0A4Z2IDS8_9TELE|nr:hypothetical protein EYF80_013527 [Liparis tanakae]
MGLQQDGEELPWTAVEGIYTDCLRRGKQINTDMHAFTHTKSITGEGFPEGSVTRQQVEAH